LCGKRFDLPADARDAFGAAEVVEVHADAVGRSGMDDTGQIRDIP
jgi:hypothetical protein